MNAVTVHLPALQVVVPLLTAPLVMLLRERNLAWAATTAASLCAVAISFELVNQVRGGGLLSYEVGAWPAPFGIEIIVDSLSALLLVIVSGASSVALLVARTSLGQEVPEGRQHLFYTAWLLALAGLN